MLKQLFLLTLLLVPTFTLASNSNIFSQDDDYIYRSIPGTIDVTNSELMSKLIQAATQETLVQSKRILAELEDYEYATYLEEVQEEIASYLSVQEHMDALNTQVEALNTSKKSKGWYAKDLLPKALTIQIGLSGSGSLGPSVSGSISYGIIVMIDRVDRVSKDELVKFLKYKSDFTIDEISSIFEEIDKNSLKKEVTLLKDTVLGGQKKTLKAADGSKLTVLTRFEPDTAQAVLAAPAIGVGVGGGSAIRVGMGAAWWRGNKLMEPEDLYGLGLAYSQDVSFIGTGYNLKGGPMNSDNASGWIDFFYSSFSFSFGPQTEFSPIKANVVFLKQPLWLFEMLGLEKKAESLLQKGIDDTFTKRWEDLTGIPSEKRRRNKRITPPKGTKTLQNNTSTGKIPARP